MPNKTRLDVEPNLAASKQTQPNKQNHHRKLSQNVPLLRLIAMLTLCSFFLISGCLRAPQQGEPGGAAPAVVTIWHTLQGSEAAALQAQVDALAKNNPTVLIRLKYVAEQSFVKLSYQAEAGGEGPEIFLAPSGILRQLYAEGAISPVVQYTSDAFPGLVTPFRFGGKLYAQPLLTDVPLLYYRTDAGLAPTALADLSQGLLVVPQLSTQVLSTWLTVQGGKVSVQGKPQMNSSENLAFLQQLLAWREGGSLKIDPDALNTFATGRARFTIAYASQAPAFTQLNIPWNALPLNSLTAGQGQVLPGSTLAIANSSIKTVGPMVQPIRLVEEGLLSTNVEATLAKAGQHFPASTGYYQRPEAGQGIAPQVGQSLGKVWAFEGNALDWRLLPILDGAWQNAFNGQNPVDALNAAQSQGEAAAAKK